MSNIMVECVSCNNRTLLDLSPAQLSDIGAAGETWMACRTCGRDTKWKAADFGRRSGEDRRKQIVPQTIYVADAGSPNMLQGSAFQNERRSTDRRQTLLRNKDRIPMQVPICVRYENVDTQFEEITRTINISPRGVYFKSNRPYSMGATVFVTLNYSVMNPGANIEKLGNVVRVEPPVAPSDFKGIAMQLL